MCFSETLRYSKEYRDTAVVNVQKALRMLVFIKWLCVVVLQSVFDFPVMEDNNPKGTGWLFHSKALQMYLNLLSSSEKNATLEASAGALQNLTANEGVVRLTNLSGLVCTCSSVGFRENCIVFYVFK